MIQDKDKIQVMYFLNTYMKRFKGTIYYRELLALRLKYIYKDISSDEFAKDIQYLKDIKKLLS